MGQNLYEAVLRLRPHSIDASFRLLWIDRICINQNDLVERSKQVTAMHTIYSSCHGCLIWLGEGLRESADILRLVKFIFENRADYDKSNSWSAVLPLLSTLTTPPASKEHIEHLIRQLLNLSERDWFNRAWTFQEAILPPKLTVLFGEVVMPFEHLYIFSPLHESTRLQSMVLVRQKCAKDQELGFMNLGEEPFPFTRRWALASDDKDRVYSLIGLLPQSSRRYLITDYTKSMSQVYADLARLTIIHTSSLRHFLLRKQEQYHGTYQCPSWVPDWRTPVSLWEAVSFEVRDRHSFGSLGSKVAFVATEDPSTLSLYGIILGEINQVESYKDSDVAAEFNLDTIYRFTNQSVFTALRQCGFQGEELRHFPQKVHLHHPQREIIETAFSPSESSELCPECSTTHIRLAEPVQVRDPARNPDEFDHLQSTHCEAHESSVFKTTNGVISISDSFCQVAPGDVVYCLFGCDTPVILRPVQEKPRPMRFSANKNGWKTFKKIGLCYAHGFMNGELLYQRTGTQGFNPEYYPFSDPDGSWDLTGEQRRRTVKRTVFSSEGKAIAPDGSLLPRSSHLDHPTSLSLDPEARFFSFVDEEGISGLLEGEKIMIV